MKKQIADTLKKLRKTLGYSPEMVIDKLAENGFDISVKTLYGYESGSRQPKADMFLQICKIYGVSSFDIFFNETPKKHNNNYDNLNKFGKQKADEYINDLSENEKYTKKQKSVSDDIVEELKQDAIKATANIK